MKKLTLLIAFVAIIASSASAQGFTWGVRAGMNVSGIGYKVDGERLTGTDRLSEKIGFNAGVMVDYGFSERFSIESGLYYSLLGAMNNVEITGPNMNYSLDQTANLSYLQLPILAKYSLPISKKSKWSIGAGPYIGYGIGGKTTTKETINGESESESYKSFSKIGNKDLDFGLTAATGVTLGKVYLGFKYDFGLVDTFQGPYTDSWNRNFSINVGYNF